MQQVALRLAGDGAWVHLGGAEGAGKPREVVIRAFDVDVEAATGTQNATPDCQPVRVPRGEGRRLVGLHFFVRSPTAGRISMRGL